MSVSKIVFKEHDNNQLMLLPPSLDSLIPDNHPVIVINKVIDRIDLQLLTKNYKGGGTSSYHPRILLKLLVYGYVNNVYSSRKLEALCKENIPMMWLTGMASPDHNTINRFRGDKLKGVLKEVFTQVVLLLAESGHLDLKDAYTDGTKIEANANKYTFVWGKSIKTNKEKMVNQLEELWSYSQQVAEQEATELDLDPASITPDMVEKTLETIEKNLSQKPKKELDKEKRRKLIYSKKNYPNKLREYKEKEVILNGRNSYSKTDTDATFMRMKEDHMRNGQLKPAYNLQITTNKQYILHYTLHPNPTDTLTLIPHFNSYKQFLNQLPDSLTADAGYGSEENYEYLKDKEVTAFVKFNYFHKEQRKKKNHNIKDVSDLHYNQEKDHYICPMGQQMVKKGESTRKTSSGYEQRHSVYEAENCSRCPLIGACHKSKGNRKIQVNHHLNQYKDEVRERLLSEEGIAKRKQRPADVEAVFGNIKQNKNFKRFSLRGKEKVEIETGLIALAHNLGKVA